MFSTITPPIESYKEEQKCFEFLIMLRTNVQVLLIRNEGRRKYSNIKNYFIMIMMKWKPEKAW